MLVLRGGHGYAEDNLLAAIVILPLVVSLLLAYGKAWVLAATVAMTPAFPLQLLGFTGTCTQGSVDPFMTGAILSAPLLLGAIGLMAWGFYTGRTSRLSCSIATATSLALLALTREAWLNGILSGTPCGGDYPATAIGPLAIILFSYLALPLLLAVCTAWRAVRP